METTVWKEKCIGNKLNIYTSIQCVVSRGLTLGKLGISQSRDCTQWGIHSHSLLKWSQNNKQFWVDSFITQIVPIHHMVFAGLSSWATSCLTKLISTTTIFKQFNSQKKLQAGPVKQKKGFEIQHQLDWVFKVLQELRSRLGLLHSHLLLTG